MQDTNFYYSVYVPCESPEMKLLLYKTVKWWNKSCIRPLRPSNPSKEVYLNWLSTWIYTWEILRDPASDYPGGLRPDTDEHGQPSNGQVYIGFFKSFRIVLHQRLLATLEHDGVRGNIFSWIASWLKQRNKRVVLNGKYSKPTKVLSGVPQKSVYWLPFSPCCLSMTLFRKIGVLSFFFCLLVTTYLED